ncbi:hypothetical protein D3C83_83760 [compost metagenome]
MRHQVRLIRPVEHPDDVQVGKPFDVREAGLKLWLDFKDALGVVLRSGPFGNRCSLRVGTADISNGNEHHLGQPVCGRPGVMRRALR